jgi:hypothetical protein
MFTQAYQLDVSTLWTQLGYWLAKVGHPVAMRSSDEPYGLLADGRWREAAEFWRDAGCPYEHAMALAESSEPDDLLQALAILDAIDAKPLGRIVPWQPARV